MQRMHLFACWSAAGCKESASDHYGLEARATLAGGRGTGFRLLTSGFSYPAGFGRDTKGDALARILLFKSGA
jgi:hypothetical protein